MARHQSFTQALEKSSDRDKKPHLLLGNGFSRACITFITMRVKLV